MTSHKCWRNRVTTNRCIFFVTGLDMTDIYWYQQNQLRQCNQNKPCCHFSVGYQQCHRLWSVRTQGQHSGVQSCPTNIIVVYISSSWFQCPLTQQLIIQYHRVTKPTVQFWILSLWFDTGICFTRSPTVFLPSWPPVMGTAMFLWDWLLLLLAASRSLAAKLAPWMTVACHTLRAVMIQRSLLHKAQCFNRTDNGFSNKEIKVPYWLGIY